MNNNYKGFSTGIEALDEILQMILPGDNLVWQVNEVDDYCHFAKAFAKEAIRSGRKLVYFRFASHKALIDADRNYKVKQIDPSLGFETFTIEIRKVIQKEKDRAWYLFDSLSDLQVHWYSDLMLGNFFVLICPYVLHMKSLAYFSLMMNRHSISVAAQIRKTTQILIDIFRYREERYIQPLKVDQRRSPTMYLPHRVENDRFVPITDSATIAQVASILTNSNVGNTSRVLDVWERTFISAQHLVDETKETDLLDEIVGLVYKKLLNMVLSQDKTILALAEKYLSLKDIMNIKKRLIGTGRIGGKSVGMLLARAILCNMSSKWHNLLEIHDSFYIGSDVYYTFIVQNGCWEERQRQREESTLLTGVEDVCAKILNGFFPDFIIEQLVEMLDYYGQSPIIVRSSSLLEDNYGNAFSGKYESVFCVNQGTREERLEALLNAIRRVFASTMRKEALVYRSQRHLLDSDEQMALLVQRVSGSVHGTMFMPHLAGVGYSFNPYAWSPKIDPASGVLRIVCGLGTRAVDRHDDDYTRIVALNEPNLLPEKSLNAMTRFTQSHVDVLDLQENAVREVNFDLITETDDGFPLHVLASRHNNGKIRLSAEEYEYTPWLLTFEELLTDLSFAEDMHEMLHTLQDAYGSPVDVEFTTNFHDNSYQINLVQCRPLQTTIYGDVARPPRNIKRKNKLFDIRGAIIGANQIIRIDQIIYVVPETYGLLKEQERYEFARLIGRLMHLKTTSSRTVMLMGPGRWGTSIPALGIPVTFTDINNVSVLCEMVEMNENMIPDVSLGTHFFNDIVEAKIIYLAIFPQIQENFLNREFFANEPNMLVKIAPAEKRFEHLVRIIDTSGFPLKRRIIVNANTLEQRAFCYIVGG